MVKVQQRVEVTVLQVDLERKRISLSMRRKSGKVVEKKSKQISKAGKKRPPDKRGPAPFNNPFVEALKK